ncbi:MAG TPA: hypothetical protein VF804_00790, partial [Holophagaceae bacterium]
MRRVALLLALAPLLGAQATRSPRVERLVAAVAAPRLQTTVAKLVTFGTRHTLSEATSPHRGIGAARAWRAGQFADLARLPGSRLRPFED